MQRAQRRGKKTLSAFPGEQCGSKGVTGSRCPACCQEPQGLESKPSRWLPSAPGTSCHCQSPKAHEYMEKTNRSQPSFPPAAGRKQPAALPACAGGVGVGRGELQAAGAWLGREKQRHGLLQPSCRSPLGRVKACETLPALVASRPGTRPPVPHGMGSGGEAGGGSGRDGEQLRGCCGVPGPPTSATPRMHRQHRLSAPMPRENLGQGLILPRTRGSSWGCSRGRDAVVEPALKGTRTATRGATALMPPWLRGTAAWRSIPIPPGRRPREPAWQSSQLQQETGKRRAPAGSLGCCGWVASEPRGRAAKFPDPHPNPPLGAQKKKNPLKKKKNLKSLIHHSASVCFLHSTKLKQAKQISWAHLFPT